MASDHNYGDSPDPSLSVEWGLEYEAVLTITFSSHIICYSVFLLAESGLHQISSQQNRPSKG